MTHKEPWIRIYAECLWQAERQLRDDPTSPNRPIVERQVAFLRCGLAEERAKLLNWHRRSGDR